MNPNKLRGYAVTHTLYFASRHHLPIECVQPGVRAFPGDFFISSLTFSEPGRVTPTLGR